MLLPRTRLMRIPRALVELAVDDRGQDMIEYGLLAAMIGIAGFLLMPPIQAGMNLLFTTSETGAYNTWCPKDPGGGTVCSSE